LYGCDGLVVVAALRRSVPPSLQRKWHEVHTRDELLVADAQVVERMVKMGWLRMGELLMVSSMTGSLAEYFRGEWHVPPDFSILADVKV